MAESIGMTNEAADREIVRLEAEVDRLRAELEAERRQAQKWLGASRAVTDGTMDELGAAEAENARLRGELARERERVEKATEVLQSAGYHDEAGYYWSVIQDALDKIERIRTALDEYDRVKALPASEFADPEHGGEG